MVNESIALIEKSLISQNIQDYEIFLEEKQSFETIFLKDAVNNEREAKDLEYFIRILNQKEKKTGIGVVRGNSLDSKQIEKNVEYCIQLSKTTLGPKYYFPSKRSIPNVNTADQKIIQDPISLKRDLSEKLILEIRQTPNVQPTFGRFRIHINYGYLKNSNGVDLKSLKTYFFIEFTLKAQKNGMISEYWPLIYIKERNQLDFKQRIATWAKYAKDTLIAKPPMPDNNAIVIFHPHLLKNAINPVIDFHSSGKAFHEKLSTYMIDEKVGSDKLTIYDDGLLEGTLNTNGWDGEGNACQRTAIIKDGIFINRLYDQKYALLEKVSSTGNGRRDENGIVYNGITNLEILSGDVPLEEMIGNIKSGYFIINCAWLNPGEISGSFGTEIRNGYYIKDGKFQNPIKGGNLSGNVLKMMSNCEYISKEREYSSNTLFPYIAFSGLTISY